MNASAIVPLVAFVCYGALLGMVAKRSFASQGHEWLRLRRHFALYLACMLVWSFASFMMHADLGVRDALFWNRILVIGASGMPIAFFAFVQVFLDRRKGALLFLGVLSYIAILAVNAYGSAIANAKTADGRFRNEYGPGIALAGASWAFFILYSARDLVRALQVARDPLFRDRIKYLLIVVIVIFVGSLTNVMGLGAYPVDVAFNAIGAVLIAYAILRHRLLDIALVARQGLLYSISSAVIGTSYFLILTLVTRAFSALAGLQVFLLSVAVALLTAILVEPLRARIQLWIDRSFFRDRYDSARMLQRLGETLASELDIDKLANSLLDEVTSTAHIEKTAFFLMQEGADAFRLMAHRGIAPLGEIVLRGDHPLIQALAVSERALIMDELAVTPQFKSLWGHEREDLAAIGAEMCVPVRAKGQLVGILAVGTKLSAEPFSQDDQITLTTLASQMAIAIDNARLFREAQQELAQRERVQRDLRESEQRYRGLFDGMPVGLYRSTPSGRILDANRALVQMLRFPSREALLASSALEMFESADARSREQISLEGEGIVLGFEARLRRYDGTVIWIRDTARAVTAADGEVLCYEGSLEDVTERRRADDDLRWSHETQMVMNSVLHLSLDAIPLRQLLDNALPVIIAVLGAPFSGGGALLLAEPNQEGWAVAAGTGDQHGLAPECAINQAKVRFRDRQVWPRAIETKGPEGTSRSRGADHGHCLVPILLGERPLALLSLCLEHDSQPDARAEDFLNTVANALAGIIVRSRSEEERERIQQQLLQSQKMEAVGRLAGGVAHDFNNLLTAIISYADFVLYRMAPDDERRPDVDEIKKASKRAASLTRQLLAYSRKQILQPEIASTNEIVLDLGKMLGRLLGERIELNMVLEPGLQTVKVDIGQIEQVIMNLAINAGDAMPNGGKLIIRTENVRITEAMARGLPGARPGRFVRLSITDSGIGMDEEILDHIFEPFFTTKEVGKGTGLGLAVVYGIIAQHEGWIGVESEPGKGSQFSIYLPSLIDKVAAEPETEATLDALQGQGQRILVVEDEPSVRVGIQRTLAENGYTVFQAASAAEALEIYARERGDFHLLLSDVVLPGESGLHLASRLVAEHPRLRVLLTSGYTERQSDRAAIGARGFPFLQKPYSSIRLLQAIRDAIAPDLSPAMLGD